MNEDLLHGNGLCRGIKGNIVLNQVAFGNPFISGWLKKSRASAALKGATEEEEPLQESETAYPWTQGTN